MDDQEIVRMWLDGDNSAHLCKRCKIPECHRDAVALLDAAQNDAGYAQIAGVGRRRLAMPRSHLVVVYDLDACGRSAVEKERYLPSQYDPREYC